MTDDPSTFQRSLFLTSEGDAYFARNTTAAETDPDFIDSALERFVPSGTSVLEIGCAGGHRLRRLSETLGLDDLAGVDPSARAIDVGRGHRGTAIDLRIGTADAIPFDRTFDVVLIAFCLYLCDRALLPRIVAEVDRTVVDGGRLIIWDFDPPTPRRRRYRHRAGAWSYKMDHASLFLGFPQYRLLDKLEGSHDGWGRVDDEGERIALWVLEKDTSAGFPEGD